ncbi:NADPH-dependent FMN reductase [Flavobacterium aquiphilum]|uniref:NADPH-dependent FMN reductase n=1 Tax=Flavobacterium aquiphilum TaxID=3003261 RepID=UPI002480B031|nr:NADPH-dependent FMN reductase [Flavobacterium aquiphilum]
MKKILAINGSASDNSSNQKLIEIFADMTKDYFSLKVFDDLKSLPHFNPELSTDNTPEAILKFRQEIEMADGILICTLEYVFSIPSGLKNAIEWCVSTTVFSEKPTAIITASASGEKGHEELQLIMKTLMAKFTPETTLLIQGIKGKIDAQGLLDTSTKKDLANFTDAFKKLIEYDRL